jgi:hypothetical protein
MQRSRSIREVLEALEWVRREMMHRGSPDFIRQRELEARVGKLSARLARGRISGGQHGTGEDTKLKARLRPSAYVKKRQ